jgi:DNA-binding MarR family transcriptional regulator
MGIQKDIQQSRFANSRHKGLINILFTYGWLIERIKNILAREGITHQQFNILRILRGSYPNPLSTLQIRDRMLDKMSDTSRIVDRLIIKGLVVKTISSKDKRLVDVVISQKGQELLSRIDEGPDIVMEIMSNISEQEAESMSHILDKIRYSLN